MNYSSDYGKAQNDPVTHRLMNGFLLHSPATSRMYYEGKDLRKAIRASRELSRLAALESDSFPEAVPDRNILPCLPEPAASQSIPVPVSGMDTMEVECDDQPADAANDYGMANFYISGGNKSRIL